MMHRNVQISRIPAVLILIWGLLWPISASGNVMPEFVNYFHIREPSGPEWCSSHPITHCNHITRYTEAEGLLEIDYFLKFPVDMPDELRALSANFSWPAAWSLVDYQVCPTGYWTFDPISGGAHLELYWSFPPVPEDTFVLVLRLILQVESYGYLSTSGNVLLTAGPVGGFYELSSNSCIFAEAGVTCTHCDDPCQRSTQCWIVPDQEYHHFLLHPDETESRVVEFGYNPAQCHETWLWQPEDIPESSESWLEAVIQSMEYTDGLLELTVDTAGLSAGDYHGWIWLDTRCRSCIEVDLTVTGESGVEEDPPVPGMSWGWVKSRYR